MRVTAMRKESGFILVLTMMVMVGLLGATATLLTLSSTNVRNSQHLVAHEQAFQMAEAGLDQAFRTLYRSSLSWNDELTGADGVAGTGDDGVLSIGLVQALPQGLYSVRVLDNNDEPTGNPDNPWADVDGVIRAEATSVHDVYQRTVTGWIWALFNHAIAANLDIVSHESSFFGNIHANRDIVVEEAGVLVGDSQATASGVFVGETLVHTAGDLIGGDPSITFFAPDATALWLAITRWSAPNINSTIALQDGMIAGYPNGPLMTPNTVTVTPGVSGATLVLFDGRSIRFREKLGAKADGTCPNPLTLQLNVLALGGGSITFDEVACLRGLIWAAGPVTLAERSSIAGAIISATDTVSIGEKSRIVFDRGVFTSGLLPGFAGASFRAWQEE